MPKKNDVKVKIVNKISADVRVTVVKAKRRKARHYCIETYLSERPAVLRDVTGIDASIPAMDWGM
jgi:hypothetical protein